ncbi:AvrE-family type 3 secretion system effector [Pantoea sp. paga]|nr:AvrE-family type 3 secretion system effector [Pantoea sp. paga]
MLNRMGQSSSAGKTALTEPAEAPASAVPSTPSEITEENDDSEFEQLHQQRLARERNNPLPPPSGPVARRFQPTLSPVAQSLPKAEASQKLLLLQTQSPLKSVPSNATPPAPETGRVRRPTLGELLAQPEDNGSPEMRSSPVSPHLKQLHNFSEVRQSMLNRMGQSSSAGKTALTEPAEAPASAVPSTPSEITEENDDSEFEQLHQQRLARERNNPLPPPSGPVARRFQPTLSPVAQSLPKAEASQKLLLLQTQSPLKSVPVSPISITIDNGKLQLGGSNLPAINTLLEQTLGKDGQRYLAHSASADSRQHLLLDNEGRLFDIRSHEVGYSVLHNSQSSTIRTQLTQNKYTPVRLENDNGKIAISLGAEGQNRLSLNQPGDVQHALISGIWQHSTAAGIQSENEYVRLHDDKIHILNHVIGVWKASGNTPYSQLSSQGDGKLYAVQDGRTLHNLSDNHVSEKFVDKIKSFSVSERGQVAILTDTDSPHHLCLMPSTNAPAGQRIQFSLHLADTMLMLQRGESHLDAESIAISNERLYAADSEGKLYSGVLSQIRDGELPMEQMSQKVLNQHFGHDHRIEGFFTDYHGQLNALVKDNFRQQHACPLGNDHQFQAGWNLSDTLVINSQLGMDNGDPAPHNILNLGREGSLILQDGKVHYFDQLTKGWSSAESGCQQLKKGLDGGAYILKEGEVKRLYINHSTSSISQGKDNFFALPHVRNKPEPGSALQGLDKADKADKAQAIAVIGVNHYLALSDKEDIRSYQIRPGTQQLARPPRTLSREGLSGTLKDIHIDHEQNLYAVNHDGEIFHQPREQWQNGKPASGWKKLAMPHNDSDLDRLEMDGDHQPVATLVDGSRYELRGEAWHAQTSAEPTQLEAGLSNSQQVFVRLNRGVKGRLIPGTGVTVKASAQFMAQTCRENWKIRSKFVDRIRAYIFNPTMTTPRPLKNAAYNLQHRWQGRKGLSAVYEMQGALIKQLESQNARNSTIQTDLHSKLDALDLGEQGTALLNDMKRFREELEQSATRSAIMLGQHQGVLNSNGQINDSFKPSLIKAAIQSFNVNRSGRDLSKALEQAVLAAAPSPQSKLQTLLSHFVSAGLNMSHQKGDMPMGRQRDPNDQTSLTKSRLILDTVTLGELHQLADKAALVSGHKPYPSQVQQLRQQFDALREKQYGANPVKQFTDMGFTHNTALEADYDAVKAFINAFSKEHHGVNLTTRTVLETQGNPALEKKLKDTLLSLDAGERLSFSRAYGGGLSTAFAPTIKKVPVPIVPGAGITLDRAYNLSFGRTTGALEVGFSRDGGATGTVSVSTGRDLMPYMTGKKTIADNASDWLSKKHKISPDLRIGATLSSNLQRTLQNSLSFKLTEDELPSFLKGLIQGTLNPVELMQKGIEHQMRQGSKLVFNVDVSAALDLHAGINITDCVHGFDTVTFRASTGLRASANLVTASRARSKQRGELSNTVSASDNRPTFLNSAALGANITLNAGVANDFIRKASINDDGTKKPEKKLGTLPAFVSTNVSVSLAMDNRTTQSISVEMKQAEPVTLNDIGELVSTLAKHFKDSASTKFLSDLNKQQNPDPAKQLSDLLRHFSGSNVMGDDRYEAVRRLKQLGQRQQASESNMMKLGTAIHTTQYSNLSRLDENGIVDLLRHHFTAALPSTSATRLSKMMDRDPRLKSIIKQLQTTPFSNASVSMELKDDLRDKTEKAILEGKIGRDELGGLFQDRNNLRISSISVSQNVTISEGFNMPALILSASNRAGLSMERIIGTINFIYGQDQETPRRFTLAGEIAKANAEVASALSELKKEGFEMKS